MFPSYKKKNQSLPNINSTSYKKSPINTVKYLNNSGTKPLLFNKFASSTINSSLSLLTNKKNMLYTKDFFFLKKKNKSLLEPKYPKKKLNFENIKIYKGKIIEVPNNKEINKKNNEKEIKLLKDFKKRNIYLFRSNCNYSCSMDKNNTFNIKFKDKPKENLKQETINIIYEQNRRYDNEYKLPRMVGIEKKNQFIFNEVVYHQWKYPDLFSE